MSPPLSALPPSTNRCSFISASHVSARNLKAPCPPSLLKALHEDFVDRFTWHDSYMEEKDGLIANDTYVEISLQSIAAFVAFPRAFPKSSPPCAA